MAMMIDVRRNILQENQTEANAFRKGLAEKGTFMVDIMGSPGAGKTSVLLELAKRLPESDSMAVIEADIESTVDSMKMKEAGICAVQLETHGICHVDMNMVEKAYAAFGESIFDYVFLENIGNLVCPADFDTGAHLRVVLLSVPEGYDKVYKYPIIFSVCDALVVTKRDYLPLNPDFDMDALFSQARSLNPKLQIFVTSARTGEGMDDLAAWLGSCRKENLAL